MFYIVFVIKLDAKTVKHQTNGKHINKSTDSTKRMYFK